MKKGFLLAVIGWIAALSPAWAVNNDGKTDVFWRNDTTKDNAAWAMDGVSYSSSVTLAFLDDTSWKMVGTGDFNKDGQLDLLWRHATTGIHAVWFMSADYLLSAAYLQPLSDTNWVVAATGYFDGPNDKSTDILWRNTATGDNAIWYMDGTKLLSSVLIQEVPDLNWKIGGTGDLNNDGYTDIVWRHATTGLNYVWYMQGSNLITPAQLQAESSTNWEIVGTGYFSGANDTTVDLLWRNKSTGDNAIWQMNGATFVSATSLPYAALAWKVGGTGDSKVDTDSDGLPDLWERNYFGNLSQTASADPDSDGFSNSQEYQNGTDPSVAGGDPQLKEAVDNEVLTWTSGGNANWHTQAFPYYSDYDSAQSGSISDNQTSWMETTFVGGGTLYYFRKVSSEEYGDYLRVYKNGEEICCATSGEKDWEENYFYLNPGVNVVRFAYVKNGSNSAGSDAAWIDLVRLDKGGGYMDPSDLAEALDNTSLSWQTAGNNTWWALSRNESVYGGDVGRAGSIYDDQQSYIYTSVTGPGYLSFYWKVDSEPDYDWLRFKLDWTEVTKISGHPDWAYQSFYIPSGTHTLSWHYTKDSDSREGYDIAYLDYVRFQADSDGDGLPDPWENQYFGSTGSQNGSGDYDADGLTNLQEYLQGAIPTLSELKVKVLSPRTNSLLP